LENTATTGILLVNLGTPDSPATGDVRRYLIEFLTDPRVIDIPAVQRHLLVRGIIGPFRAPKSAKSYREIWTKEGSPLLLNSQSQREGVAELLGPGYQVELAMRYQNPSITSVLERFKGKRLRKLRIIPLFPQYASASTGSVHAEVMRIVSQWQVIPDIEFVNSYPTHPGMIDAFADLARPMQPASYDHVLFSFHGLPERQLIKADAHGHCIKAADCCSVLSDKNHYCYSAQCHATAQALAAKLDIPKEKYTICYQSRLGKTPWVRPYTIDVIKELAESGKKRVLAFSPAFTSDCLETIFEIGEEYNEDFQKWGGEKMDLVPGLNAHPTWIAALADICKG
jgi:protoporphyrin/coproporphyrin ferrochelatase